MPKHDRKPIRRPTTRREQARIDAEILTYSEAVEIDLDELRRHVARQLRRRPPKGGEPVLAVPPRGPLPLVGGAEAPIE